MLHLRSPIALTLAFGLPILLGACGSEPTDTAATVDTEESEQLEEGSGQLEIRANGEDFVRQGFVTKDGWQIDFDHLYVTLTDVTVYQSDPPFDALAEEAPEADVQIKVEEPVTVDLAAGDEAAEPILVKTVEAPAGRYNALAWKVTPAPEGPAAGYPIFLQGQATKADETIAFTLKLEPSLEFVCGDFVGDERKGILAADETADLEATFHFDHLFGDGEAPPEDEINTGALGFDPLAAIAEGGTLEADTAELEAQLAPEDYATLVGILPSLGHVGEGHCAELELSSR